MSASMVLDLRNGCDYRTSVIVGSGSNLAVGEIVDLLGADHLCNIFVAAGIGSGPINVRVQTSDGLTSGSFTDPTSGLAVMPSSLLSGGNFWCNSGLMASGYSSLTSRVNNAPEFCSGGIAFGFFQRPQRYARLILDSGAFLNSIVAGFVSQKLQTGSGAGTSPLPGSGGILV